MTKKWALLLAILAFATFVVFVSETDICALQEWLPEERPMNHIDFYVALFVTNVMVVGGWITSVALNRGSLRRSQRVRVLAEAYDTLVRTGIDGGIPARRDAKGQLIDYSRDLERAVANIHLYGSRKHVRLVNIFVKTLSNENFYNADELVAALKDEVRSEMGMAKFKGKLVFLKQSIAPKP